jgi:hypothetical protein
MLGLNEIKKELRMKRNCGLQNDAPVSPLPFIRSFSSSAASLLCGSEAQNE